MGVLLFTVLTGAALATGVMALLCLRLPAGEPWQAGVGRQAGGDSAGSGGVVVPVWMR